MKSFNIVCPTIFKIEDQRQDDELQVDRSSQLPADFERAIEATNFGKFNILLLCLTMPSLWAVTFESTSVSYIVSVAQCDLQMSLTKKGYLIAATYFGMFTSGFMWGYLADTLGRKKLLVIGCTLAGLFALLSGFSQTFPMLLVGKFMGGFIISGLIAVITVASSEFHCAKHRAKISLFNGVFVNSVAIILLPLLAWGLLPNSMDVDIIKDYLVLHSWNIFLIVCTIPSFLSVIVYWLFVPESPKFLMSCGKNKEALEIFKRVYTMNTGKPPGTFPITELVDRTHLEMNIRKSDCILEIFKKSFNQITPLFERPHLKNFLLICVLQMGSLMSYNCFRLWLPQVFDAYIDHSASPDYEQSSIFTTKMGPFEELDETSLDWWSPRDVCPLSLPTKFVYTDSITVGLTSMGAYLLVAPFANLFTQKHLLSGLFLISGIFASGTYFCESSMSVTLLSSICIALLGITNVILLNIIDELFPTGLKPMAVIISLMAGRASVIVGNVVYPVLIDADYLPIIALVAIPSILCGVLALLLSKSAIKL